LGSSYKGLDKTCPHPWEWVVSQTAIGVPPELIESKGARPDQLQMFATKYTCVSQTIEGPLMRIDHGESSVTSARDEGHSLSGHGCDKKAPMLVGVHDE